MVFLKSFNEGKTDLFLISLHSAFPHSLLPALIERKYFAAVRTVPWDHRTKTSDRLTYISQMLILPIIEITVSNDMCRSQQLS